MSITFMAMALKIKDTDTLYFDWTPAPAYVDGVIRIEIGNTQVKFQIRGQDGNVISCANPVPLLPDSQMHTYSIQIREDLSPVFSMDDKAQCDLKIPILADKPSYLFFSGEGKVDDISILSPAP